MNLIYDKYLAMAYQITYKIDDNKVNELQRNSLEIVGGGNTAVIYFEKHNLRRTIPYFLWCLNNKSYSCLVLGENSSIHINSDSIKVWLCNQPNYITLNIPWSNKDKLITEISKYPCDAISNDYINIMNTVTGKTILFTSFAVKHNDTEIVLIDNITNDEKKKFTKLSDKKDVVIRGLYYKCLKNHTHIDGISFNINIPFFPVIPYPHIVWALSNILDAD